MYDTLFDDYVGAYRLKIQSSDKKIYIHDYKNNFSCDFYKPRIREVMNKLMMYADVVSDGNHCANVDGECSLHTGELGINGFSGNWCKTDRIKPIIEKLAEVCSDVLEECKAKVTKPKTRGQLKRMKLATLISFAKDIDMEKEVAQYINNLRKVGNYERSSARKRSNNVN